MALDSGVRASDQDRSNVVDGLATAFSEGQITRAEYEERSQSALQAPTIAELRSLIGDLQKRPALLGEAPTPATSSLPPTHTTIGTRGVSLGSLPVQRFVFRLATWGALAVAIFIGVQVVQALDFSDGSAAASDDGSETTDPADDVPLLILPDPAKPLTEKGFKDLVSQMRRDLGTTVVTSLNLRADSASFDVRRPGSPGAYSYNFDGLLGVPSHNETASPSGIRIDLAKIDAARLAALMRNLPSRVGVTAPTDTYVTTQRDSDGSTVLLLMATGSPSTGYLRTTPTLDVIDVYRPS